LSLCPSRSANAEICFSSVQERYVTLGSITICVWGLTLLGFEINPNVLHAYRQRFPNDPAATDLGQWQTFENENPDTFSSMYQF
jgi:hypothetical protein